jgi:hypothetical protein
MLERSEASQGGENFTAPPLDSVLPFGKESRMTFSDNLTKRDLVSLKIPLDLPLQKGEVLMMTI